MNIHIQQLRYFLELAKQLNFTKAAINLYIAQPALSQQIADLEKQLGVTLFERTSRSVSLTPAGEILQKAAPELLQRMDTIHQQLLSAQAGLRGNLKVGYISSFQTGLPKILKNYQAFYPDVAVELFCGTIQEMRTSIKNLDADIVFGLLHKEMPFEGSGLARKGLWQEDLHLVLRKDHPFAQSGGQDYSLLREDTLCLLADETVPEFQRLVHGICDEIGLSFRKVITHKDWGPILIQIDNGTAVSVFSTRDSNLFCAYQKDLISFPIKQDCLNFSAIWNPKSTNTALPLFLDVLDTSYSNVTTE